MMSEHWNKERGTGTVLSISAPAHRGFYVHGRVAKREPHDSMLAAGRNKSRCHTPLSGVRASQLQPKRAGSFLRNVFLYYHKYMCSDVCMLNWSEAILEKC
jgi:hypothetical protein